MSWKDSILDFFEIFGPATLAVVSFTEAIIQPVPPDLLYLPMLYDAAGKIPLITWLFLVVTLSSVAGSYWLLDWKKVWAEIYWINSPNQSTSKS